MKEASENKWEKELSGMRTVLERFSLLSSKNINGIRAPFLELGGKDNRDLLVQLMKTYIFATDIGAYLTSVNAYKISGNNQFKILKKLHFLYDSSAIAANGSFWPQTLDYKPPWKCFNSKCPETSYPGIWEVPVTELTLNNSSSEKVTFEEAVRVSFRSQLCVK